MNLYRYNVTLHQKDSEARTLSIVAKDAAQAKAKGFHRFTSSLPFWTFRRSDIRAVQLEAVTGPAVMA